MRGVGSTCRSVGISAFIYDAVILTQRRICSKLVVAASAAAVRAAVGVVGAGGCGGGSGGDSCT